MRIASANIATQASKLLTSSSSVTADKSPLRRQQLEARDGYNKNASVGHQHIIDAEYVEFHTPSTNLFNQERQHLDVTPEPGSRSDSVAETVSKSPANLIDQYSLAPPKVPPPGTYIDTFA
ncbi:MAG: hypothetical protein KAT62_12030 [Desulfuromonadales bacterium]|nr:hypothetical protein [Chloroflexota bacterium]MCK4622930.1 hypothetical protein [Desulfuromonadales bacterium]